MIIGTDIVYWPASVKPLVSTLVKLFAMNAASLHFYMCYIERHTNTHKLLLKELADFNFKVEEVFSEISQAN